MAGRRLWLHVGIMGLLLPLVATTTASAQPDKGGGGIPVNAVVRAGDDGRVMLLGAPFLTDASDAPAGDIALAFVSANRRLFGLTPAQVDQLVVVDSYDTSHNGAQHVTLGQRIGGHRVAFSGLTFALDRDGRIASAGGPLARGPATGTRRLTALQAVQAAGAAAGLELPDQLPARSDRGDQRRFRNTFATTRSPNPVTAEPVWFPSANGRTLTLAWETDFEVDADTWLQSFVDARTGRVLHQGNRYVHAGPQGTVFRGQHPDDSPARSVTPFSGIDGSWVSARVTSGNNVNAYRDVGNTNTVGYQPQTPDAPDAGYQHFDYAWTDDWRTDGDGDDESLDADLDAVVTQLFYYTNVMHDWAYGYGFDEPSGNFQVDNFGRGGSGGDPVLAEAQDGWDLGCTDGGGNPVRCMNNANFGFSSDGTSPRMQMYMWSPWRPYRDGSMDGDVIAHEYGHGISDRLVGGGGSSLGYNTHLVHASLGEGWSDVISFLKWDDTTVGEYVTGNATTGIRSVAYDTSTLTYNSYNPNAGSGHPNGEVWATMLYDVREALGVDTTARLVFDGLKGTPAQPDFMDARDAIIAADATSSGGANYCLLWRLFADNGLGTGATFTKASTSPPADDDGVPADCVPTADAGGPYSTAEGTDVVLDGTGSTAQTHASGGTLSYAWDLDDDGQYDDSTLVSPTFSLVGDDASRTVGLQVTNTAGVTDTDTATVTVTNVAPTTTVDAVATTSENVAITLTGGVSDPGWLDTFPTATVDWGDGAGAQSLALGTTEHARPDATAPFSVGHTYGDDGTYTVTVCVSDDDGGSGCDATDVVISNTDPTAAIDEDTYIAHEGVSLDVSGASTDPGSDDLTATWDWGDPTADTVTPDLVNPPAADPLQSPTIQPRAVTWNAAHTYTDACLYTLGLSVVDDDGGGPTADTATVVITGSATRVFGSGYWMNQYREKNPNVFTAARLDCYLAITRHMSDVFVEAAGPLATRADAVSILNVKQNSGTDLQLFDEQLLAAWLNFANGGRDLDTLVDTDGDGIADTTFGDALTTAETVRLDPTATRAQLLAQKDVLERIVTADG